MSRPSDPAHLTEEASDRTSYGFFSNQTSWPTWAGYLITLAAEVVLVTALILIDPFLPLGRYPMSYIVLVMLAAYIFGAGPAILAFLVGWIAFDYFFLPPLHTFWPIATTSDGWAGVISYILGALIVGLASAVEGISKRHIQRLLIYLNKELAERKQIENELRETTQRLNALLENSPLALIEWDSDYRIVRWTDGAKELFGWNADEALGRRIDEFRWVYEEDWPIVQQLMDNMIEGKRARNVNPNRNYRKDGSVIYCEWYNSVLRDESGRMTGVLSLILDVTERKQADEALRHQVYLLQRALLPTQPPRVEGYSFASAYIPAVAGQEVGGDFYDVLMTEDGMVGIMIGDVSGKGIEAAALAAVTRSTVNAFVYDSSVPGYALTLANSMLVSNQTNYYQFVTAFLVVLDSNTGNLSYSSAGHPPAMIYRENGQVEFLVAGNTPLGVIKTKEFVQGEAVLMPGDKLILYTDGITEARSGSNLFGMERLENTVIEHGGESADELVAGILNAASDWAHGNLRDDTAVLIVGREK